MIKRKYIAAATGIALFLSAATLAQAAGLTSSQISAIVNLLQVFGADQSIIATVQAELTGQPVTPNPSSNSCSQFVNLQQGDTDATTGGLVSQLQQFLGIYPTTGYYGVHTSIAFTNKCQSNNAQPTSVAGMSQYTDSNFGFSFWYPSGWSVEQNSVSAGNTFNQVGGTVLKILHVDSADGEGAASIYEVSSPTGSITDEGNGGGADFENNPVTYFFSSNTESWMSTISGNTAAADVSNNTMGGLHMLNGISRFDTSIIPLSANNFVIINDGGGYGARPLAQTIVATDPTVAIPVSTAQQITTVQAEASAYRVSANSQGNSVFSAAPTSGQSPLSVTFSSAYGGPTGVPTGYQISFGDGSNQWVNCAQYYIVESDDVCNNDVQIQHTYASAGTYSATLNAITSPSAWSTTYNSRVIGTVTIIAQ